MRCAIAIAIRLHIVAHSAIIALYGGRQIAPAPMLQFALPDLLEPRNGRAREPRCAFRGMAATDSDLTRPPIPIHRGHRIRRIAASLLRG